MSAYANPPWFLNGGIIVAKDERSVSLNEHDERALWLRAAADALREDFEASGLPLPANICFGFSTKGKGTQKTGECWLSPASADGAYEVFIRADQGDALDVLGILVRELVHAALPVKDSHGKKFKAAAAEIGLIGKMRAAVPGRLLEGRLHRLLEDLGPLPHAALDITWSAFAKPKRQTGRMLKATCVGGNDDGGDFKECGYTVRLASKWAKEYGAQCPKHGAIAVEFPSDDPETELDQDPASAALAVPAPSEGLSGHDATGS